MTRKQIAILSSALLGGVIALYWLAGSFKGSVKILFVSGASKEPSTARFIVTNSFRKPIVYYLNEEVEHAPMVADYHRRHCVYSNYTGRIPGRAAETIDVNFVDARRWTLVVLYSDKWSPSRIDRIHTELAAQVSRLGWTRLAQWLEPKSGFERVSSPIMLGNEPAEISPK
ncbi:MAG: hypothetical protein HY043_06180 [Verrucomicrobia bacterium]|nr:hypothetical protein [Verrucomicrobiota bacterium]